MYEPESEPELRVTELACAKAALKAAEESEAA